MDRADALYSIWTLAKLLPSSIQMNAKFLQIALQEVQVAWVCVQGFYFCQVSCKENTAYLEKDADCSAGEAHESKPYVTCCLKVLLTYMI